MLSICSSRITHHTEVEPTAARCGIPPEESLTRKWQPRVPISSPTATQNRGNSELVSSASVDLYFAVREDRSGPVCSHPRMAPSLRKLCSFRMRRKRDTGWERATVRLDRRSIYLLRGPSRQEWEHSIPAVDRLRYSVTFRNFAGGSTI